MANFRNHMLSQFPRFELSYEISVHKKVLDADLCLAMPKGSRCFIWFTNDNTDDIAVLLMLNSDNGVRDVKRINISFDHKLAYGTILQGTIFHVNKQMFCALDEIYFYKGTPVMNNVYGSKLDMLKNILSNEIDQICSREVCFGIPYSHKDFLTIIREVYNLPYEVSHIQFRSYDKHHIRTMNFIKKDNKLEVPLSISQRNEFMSVFKVIPDIQNDIYHLYCIGGKGQEEFYDIAYIPNYTTSVLMNNLFRNIKENSNLDALEESDDEEEFENVREDKFVHLDRTFNMTCRFNTKFRKWYPVSLADESAHVVSASILETMKNGYNKRNTHNNSNNNNNYNKSTYKKHNSNNRYYKK